MLKLELTQKYIPSKNPSNFFHKLPLLYTRELSRQWTFVKDTGMLNFSTTNPFYVKHHETNPNPAITQFSVLNYFFLKVNVGR